MTHTQRASWKGAAVVAELASDVTELVSQWGAVQVAVGVVLGTVLFMVETFITVTPPTAVYAAHAKVAGNARWAALWAAYGYAWVTSPVGI